MSDRPRWEIEGRDWPNRETSRFVEAAGLRWHVQVMGSGPVVLLLHGTGAATHSWRDLMPLLAERFTVVAPDLPGHGFTSGRPAGGFTMPAMARAVAGLVETMGLKASQIPFVPSEVEGRAASATPGARPSTSLGTNGARGAPVRKARTAPVPATGPALIIGHSAGAAIGIRMAMDRLADPGAIIGLNPALMPFPGLAAAIFPTLAKLLFVNPFAPLIFARIARAPGEVKRFLPRSTGSAIDSRGVELYARLFARPGHVAGAITMMAEWDLDDFARVLPTLDKPLLLIHGANDSAIPVAKSHEAAVRVRGARVHEVAGGHLAHEEHPAETAALIAAFATERGLL